MTSFIDKLVFPAPQSTYTRDAYKKHLCWIPWNEAVSPSKINDPRYEDGIPCLWLPAQKAAGVILFCHGNAEDLGMCFPFVRHMRDQFKMNVLAVEYPGYGLLNGVPVCEAALKEVALTAFRFVLDELRVAYEQVILFGRSVGSGPTVYLASRFPVGGLILVAPFSSIREAAKNLVGDLIAAVLEERFPNISLIGNVSCPTLFIHGEKDTLVPPSHSVALFKQCRARKLLITPPGMQHNTNLFADAQFLAVPAINFFGLPGYQRDNPPEMPQRFREEYRQDMRPQSAARGKTIEGSKQKDGDTNPWFFLCGCPTIRRREAPAGVDDRPVQAGEWNGEAVSEWDPVGASEATEGGDVLSASRDTAAAAAARLEAAEKMWQAEGDGTGGAAGFKERVM